MGKRSKKRTHSEANQETLAQSETVEQQNKIAQPKVDSVSHTDQPQEDVVMEERPEEAQKPPTAQSDEEVGPTEEGGGLFALGDPLKASITKPNNPERMSKLGIPRWLAEPNVIAADVTVPIDDARMGLSESIIARCRQLDIDEFFAGTWCNVYCLT
jgi:hypothetical protein